MSVRDGYCLTGVIMTGLADGKASEILCRDYFTPKARKVAHDLFSLLLVALRNPMSGATFRLRIAKGSNSMNVCSTRGKCFEGGE